MAVTPGRPVAAPTGWPELTAHLAAVMAGMGRPAGPAGPGATAVTVVLRAPEARRAPRAMVATPRPGAVVVLAPGVVTVLTRRLWAMGLMVVRGVRAGLVVTAVMVAWGVRPVGRVR